MRIDTGSRQPKVMTICSLPLLLLGIVLSSSAQQCVIKAPLVFEMKVNDGTTICQCDPGEPIPGDNCPSLPKTGTAAWQPIDCTERDMDLGDVCTIYCGNGFELRGSEMIECTKDGWSGTGGLGIIPQCLTPAELGNDLTGNIDTIISGIPSGLLFIMDASTSVSHKQFEVEKGFVGSLINAFPLSTTRSAGAITFATTAAIHVHLNTVDQCGFLSAINRMTNSGGQTRLDLAIDLANQEIRLNRINNLTLVVIITDGEWTGTSPDPGIATMKNNGAVVLTIGVAKYDRKQLEPLSSLGSDGSPLHYGVSNFNVFKIVADYLRTSFSRNAPRC